MKKSLMMALAGGLMMAGSAFTFSTEADAGYGHRHHYYKVYKPYTYSYHTYHYVPACKWVFHYGHYKKVCW